MWCEQPAKFAASREVERFSTSIMGPADLTVFLLEGASPALANALGDGPEPPEVWPGNAVVSGRSMTVSGQFSWPPSARIRGRLRAGSRVPCCARGGKLRGSVDSESSRSFDVFVVVPNRNGCLRPIEALLELDRPGRIAEDDSANSHALDVPRRWGLGTCG